MGMYDYLGGEQVKVFYNPIFRLNKENPEESSFWYSMGSLQSYDKEDELPLKTLWYQYPQNFLIYDYRFEYTDVWIIKDGKFDRLISYTKLTEDDLVGVEAVYDYYGSRLNLNELAHFQQIKDHFNNRLEELNAIQKEVFPNGYNVQFVRENPEEFKRLCAIKDEKWREIDEKYQKVWNWYPESPYQEEESFGALLDCYFFTRSHQNDAPLKDIIVPSEDFKGCKLTLQRMLKETPDIIERFKAWLNDDALWKEEGIDELIKDIQKPLKVSTEQPSIEAVADMGGVDGGGGE